MRGLDVAKLERDGGEDRAGQGGDRRQARHAAAWLLQRGDLGGTVEQDNGREAWLTRLDTVTGMVDCCCMEATGTVGREAESGRERLPGSESW